MFLVKPDSFMPEYICRGNFSLYLNALVRHAGLDPASRSFLKDWIPAFAGMTFVRALAIEIQQVGWAVTRSPTCKLKGGDPMTTMRQVRHITVSINRPPKEVYAFVSNPENLPKWASGLSGSIKNVNGEWIADAPMGKVKIKFAEENKFGILDHEVVLESGVRVYNPMRVIANDKGSEIFFTLIRQPEMSDDKFAQDAKWVEKDLRILKDLLEEDL
jgi:hypothetical protein